MQWICFNYISKYNYSIFVDAISAQFDWTAGLSGGSKSNGDNYDQKKISGHQHNTHDNKKISGNKYNVRVYNFGNKQGHPGQSHPAQGRKNLGE